MTKILILILIVLVSFDLVSAWRKDAIISEYRKMINSLLDTTKRYEEDFQRIDENDKELLKVISKYEKMNKVANSNSEKCIQLLNKCKTDIVCGR